MISSGQADDLPGSALLDCDEEELGTIEEILLNPGDDTAAWAAVDHDGRRVLVPLDGAEVEEEGVRVRYAAEQVADAPEADAGALDPELQERLYEHYGISDETLRDEGGFVSEIEVPGELLGGAEDPGPSGSAS